MCNNYILIVRCIFDQISVSPDEAPLDNPCALGSMGPLVINTSISGELTTPNYPSPYSNNAKCQWIITSKDGALVRAKILDIDIEDGYMNFELIYSMVL